MSLTIGQIILKDSIEYSSPGIVQALMSSDFPGNDYAAGNRFDDNPSINYYSSENIALLYLSSSIVNSFDASLFCQTSSYVRTLSKSKILTNVSLNENSNFDDLSTMIVNAFLPLTNIRKSKFHIMERKEDGTYAVREISANAFLTNGSIMANGSLPRFMQNKASDPRLISTKDDFISYGSIGNSLQRLKTNSTQETYSANSNKYISVDILDSIFDLCIEGLNRIRTNFTCFFQDGDHSQYQRTITYHSSSEEGHATVSYTYFVNSIATIFSFRDVFSNPIPENFQGWTLTKNSGTVSYPVGSTIAVSRNFDLYPVSLGKVKIFYEDSTASQIVERGPNYIVESTEGSVYTVEGIQPPGSPRLAYKSDEFQQSYTSLFKGYAYSANSGEAVNAGDRITLENQNYYLFPKFDSYNKTLKFDRGIHWHNSGRGGEKWVDGYTDEIDLKVNLRLFSQMKVEYTGWVNEFEQTHHCDVFIEAIYVDGDRRAWDNDNWNEDSPNRLFCYSPGNGWSLYRSENATAYGTWPKTYRTYNLNNPGWNGSHLKFFFRIRDTFDDNSASEGKVYVGNIWLTPLA